MASSPPPGAVSRFQACCLQHRRTGSIRRQRGEILSLERAEEPRGAGELRDVPRLPFVDSHALHQSRYQSRGRGVVAS
jgi:hypothetical protein